MAPALHVPKGSDKTIVGFRSAKARPFAERKATLVFSGVIKNVTFDGARKW
jgi:hypothetical protein